MKILKHILVIIFCLTTFIGFGRTKTVVSPNSSHFVRINSGNLELFSLDDGTKLISIGLVEKFNIEPQNINSMILSHQGKFLLIETRFSDGNIFVIDLEKERILKKQTKESKPYLQLFAIPNSRFFVRYYKKKESRNRYFLEVISFNSKSFEPIQKLECKGEKGNYSTDSYDVFLNSEGNYLAVAGKKTIIKYNLKNLSEKTKKLDLPMTDHIIRGQFLPKINYGRGIIYSPINLKVYHSYTSRYSGNHKKKDSEVHRFITRTELSSNKRLEQINFNFSESNRPTFTPDARVIYNDSIFSLKTTEFLFALQTDTFLFELASKEFNQNNFIEAKKYISKMNLDKENYKKLAYKVFESLKDDKNQLELVENWENIPNEYGWKNSELYIRNNKLDKGLDLIKDLQAGDMRRSGESLERNKGLEKLKTNAEFKKLVQNTKYIDTITNPNHPTTQAEFDAGVGLFELYKFKAYEIVKNYKEIGIDKAVSEANRHLDSCLKYTYTYPNATAIYFLKGKLFLQAEDYVSSVNAYYNAIYFSPDSITKEWIDISIAGLQVKSLMEDELFDRRKKGIKGNTGGFYDDYKKHRTWILDLCDKYIAKFPEDPLGYYARAKTRYKFNGYYYNDKRVKDAKKTIELCKKLGYKIPEDCYEMAKEYWNQTPPTAKTNSSSNTNTASRPTRCYTNCTTCKGRGLKETNSTCGSCTGTGKRGRCYACNGRGRKYFTSNIQTCYTCGGKGTLSCYMCNGSGRKYAHKHCSTCSGSGYKCD